MLIWEYCRVISVSYFRQGGLLAQISKLCAGAPVSGAQGEHVAWNRGLRPNIPSLKHVEQYILRTWFDFCPLPRANVLSIAPRIA